MSAQAACSFCARTVRHPVLSTCASNDIDEQGSDNHMSQPQFEDSSGTRADVDVTLWSQQIAFRAATISPPHFNAVTRLHREGPPFRLKITFTETTREDRPYRVGPALVGSQTGFTEAAWRMYPQ